MTSALRQYLYFDNDDGVIQTLFELKLLHSELSSLYRVKSSDKKRIDTLWREIEKREALLELNGVEYK